MQLSNVSSTEGITFKREQIPQYVMEVPDPISGERVNVLVSKGIDRDVAEIDLAMVKLKLRESEEGVGWDETQCEEAEVEYKRYLTLCRRFPAPAYAIVPTKLIDTIWHYHILDTRAYCRDSDIVFGGYFHHFPYFGMRGDEDAKQLKASFEETKVLYEQAFGESMLRAGGESDCWHDCQSRCHNACKS